MTLSVLTGEQLDRFGIQEFDELSRFVPGFEVQNQSPNNPGFVMRGITSDSGAATNEPRVSVFQDGVSISKSRGSYVELFDLERVEIAKGPQSTLYGRGALIGAVNLIQSKAKLGRLEAAGTASFGNFNAWLGEAMVNVPLGENVAIRLAAAPASATAIRRTCSAARLSAARISTPPTPRRCAARSTCRRAA